MNDCVVVRGKLSCLDSGFEFHATLLISCVRTFNTFRGMIVASGIGASPKLPDDDVVVGRELSSLDPGLEFHNDSPFLAARMRVCGAAKGPHRFPLRLTPSQLDVLSSCL